MAISSQIACLAFGLLATVRAAIVVQSATCTAKTAAEVPEMVKTCTDIVLSSIVFPAVVLKPALVLDLQPGTTVTFEGKTVFTPNSFTNPAIKADGGVPPPWWLVEIIGTNVKIIGAPGNTIHGNGQAYWDGVGGNKGRKVNKPKFFKFNLKSSLVSGLNVVNTPQHTFSIGGTSNTTFDKISLDNKAGERPCSGGGKDSGGKSCGHNTDAFNVGGSSNVIISNAHIVNQDDCLALNSGTNITFTGGTCIGGHGISIGSIKTGNTVNGALISDSKIIDSANGVRIKTYDDATDAEVSNVKYSKITLSGITKYGVVIQQDYRNDGPTGKAGNGCKIRGLTLEDVKGSSKGTAVYINCGSGSCTNWSWTRVNVSGKKGGCKNPPSVAASHC
ncbi:glycoside hydrolase [Tothia fuscella]|uniref:endo-polygalacturonase n=1 Tax=Tothia fuscella TaxID=1048955 RepID=A0A9P4U3A2_9PEZI|nr:glycoside hydrolase [Tothia fuscella]